MDNVICNQCKKVITGIEDWKRRIVNIKQIDSNNVLVTEENLCRKCYEKEDLSKWDNWFKEFQDRTKEKVTQ